MPERGIDHPIQFIYFITNHFNGRRMCGFFLGILEPDIEGKMVDTTSQSLRHVPGGTHARVGPSTHVGG